MRRIILIISILLFSCNSYGQYYYGLLGKGNTASFNTFDPANTGSAITLSGGNLTATRSVNGISYNSSFGLPGFTHSSGKYYCELKAILLGSNTSNNAFGIGTSAAISALSSNTSFIGSNSFGWSYFFTNGCFHSGSASGPTTGWVNGDVLMMAIDITAGKVWWGINGVWLASGNPATGANPIFTSVAGTLYPILTMFDNVSQVTANFGATAYAFTPPTGFATNW